MCEVVRFYDNWVNGSDLRAVDQAFGRAPGRAPAPSPGQLLHADGTLIHLRPYGDCEPELPALNGSALAPIRHVLVHGSIATQDACAFSDIDVAVILDDLHTYGVEQHRRAVAELRRLLRAILKFDSLMHHGLMFFPASGLENYDQRFLPIDALRCARALHGPESLRLHVQPAPIEQLRATLRASLESLRKRFAILEFLRDDYRLKNVLAGILLLPARILAAQGVHVYKRESFELARNLFTPAQWELIARCEGLRATWIRPRESIVHRCIPPQSHPHLLQAAGSRFAPRQNVRRLSERVKDGLQRSATLFFDRMEAMV